MFNGAPVVQGAPEAFVLKQAARVGCGQRLHAVERDVGQRDAQVMNTSVGPDLEPVRARRGKLEWPKQTIERGDAATAHERQRATAGVVKVAEQGAQRRTDNHRIGRFRERQQGAVDVEEQGGLVRVGNIRSRQGGFRLHGDSKTRNGASSDSLAQRPPHFKRRRGGGVLRYNARGDKAATEAALGTDIE